MTNDQQTTQDNDMLDKIAKGETKIDKSSRKSDNLYTIPKNTKKFQNDFLIFLVDELYQEGYSAEDIINTLLALDRAIEDNDVENIIKNINEQYSK